MVASVNLQHIEDQREAVERLTGKKVTETIPREFLNTADEIVVVDAPTEGASLELSELRQMALVLSADVIDAGLQRYLRAHEIEGDEIPLAKKSPPVVVGPFVDMEFSALTGRRR